MYCRSRLNWCGQHRKSSKVQVAEISQAGVFLEDCLPEIAVFVICNFAWIVYKMTTHIVFKSQGRSPTLAKAIAYYTGAGAWSGGVSNA